MVWSIMCLHGAPHTAYVCSPLMPWVNLCKKLRETLISLKSDVSETCDMQPCMICSSTEVSALGCAVTVNTRLQMTTV